MKNQQYLICTSPVSNLANQVWQSLQIGKALSIKCLKQESTCKIYFHFIISLVILFMTDEQIGKNCFSMQQRDFASLPFSENCAFTTIANTYISIVKNLYLCEI